MTSQKTAMSKDKRNKMGQFTTGNPGKPKGATHKTTRQLRETIVSFLNEKSEVIPEIWDSLEPKEQATLFLHLSKLVMPSNTKEETEDRPLPAPVIVLSNPEKNLNEKP